MSNAGGFGTLGTSAFNADTLQAEIDGIRERTDKPFGVNHLLFQIQEDMFSVTLRARPAVTAFAWARKDQDLCEYFQRAHQAGCTVMYMAGEVAEASRAAQAGADVIVAEGTEAGGHVVWMASMPLVPIIVNAVAPVPVLAAGGIADGPGSCRRAGAWSRRRAAGNPFHGYGRAPIHANYKEAIVKSDAHDTVLTEIPDLASQRVWPGAMSRAQRNKFIERWAGREWALRQNGREIGRQVAAARAGGDVDNAPLSFGQDAGLIDSIKTVRDVVQDIIAEAEAVIKTRLPNLVR
jgi:NAD(P)H-dependent flavin oxidoreductase YrpB (nitropropane dioxygenase family)